jgi:hypothetical protein
MSTTEQEMKAPPAPEPQQLLTQLATGYMASSALYAAVKLEIAERLAGGARNVAELAAEAGAREDALYRLLRSLASLGVFEETEPRRFAANPAAELLRADSRESVRDLVLWMADPFHFRVYAELLHSIRTGEPAVEKVTGVPVFEYLTQDRELSESFNNAMTLFSRPVIQAALKVYDFSGIDVLVDVAGGHGEVLLSILGKYPDMRGILFDVNHVIAGAVPRIEASGLADRCTTVAGDFFKSVPLDGNAYIMKHIIHDWDDERALIILKNIREGLDKKSGGRVILLEAVLQSGNKPDMGKLIDLEMLVMPGGRERTADEFEDLFERAGFELTRILPTESPLSVIEARPR